MEQAGGPAAPVETKISKELDKLLGKVEAAGAKLKSFQAKMAYQLDQPLIDTREIRNGRLYYQAEKETVRFRIHFSDFQQIDLMEDELPPVVSLDLDYGFDGLWFTKRDARNKNIQMWEISKKPQSREYFRLGKGPFPLPLAITKADVIKEFKVKLLPVDPNDPANTEHLVLKPKKNSSFAEKYTKLEWWISKKTAVPQKLLHETNDGQITSVTWSDIKLDKKIKKKYFELAPPGRDWHVEKNPYEEPETTDQKPLPK